MVVPASALQVTEGQKYLYIAVGDKVQRRLVTTGVDEGESVEVTRGLSAEDDLVTAGADGLSDGATVKTERNVDPYSGAKTTDALIGGSGAPSASD